MTQHADVFVVGAGPAGLTCSLLPDQRQSFGGRHREEPDLRRQHQPDGLPQRFYVRHWRPPLLPVDDDAYRDNVAMIRLDLEMNYPTLHLVGRNGMHKCNNQDHAMMTTMLTARNMLAGERVGRELGRRISRGGLVRRIGSAAQRAPRFVAAQASAEYLRGR